MEEEDRILILTSNVLYVWDSRLGFCYPPDQLSSLLLKNVRFGLVSAVALHKSYSATCFL